LGEAQGKAGKGCIMSDRFQILALDGGGIKGLFSAAFLAKLEEDLSIKVVDHFDLIVGTSTGGIIALGLGLGLSPKDLVEFYFKKGPKIFQKIPIWTTLRNLLFEKYSEKTIEDIFREKNCFGEKLLGESKKRLVIPSYNIDTNDVYVFKTAHHDRFKRDHKIPVWKIARATSAAPTFFPITKNVDSIRMIDGGVWANNPAMVGLFEAIAILGIPLEGVRIFSVGTTEELKQSSRILDKFGGWLFWANTAVELIMQAQSASISAQLKLLLKDNFVRVNPKVPSGLFGLDKMNMNDLFAFASTHSRSESPIFNTKFKDHRAGEFIPVHKLER
jgi:patatin-like phospholipase/acyl hydrolase